MHSHEFMYWLQGFFELSDKPILTLEKIDIIKNHMTLVKTVSKNNSHPFMLWLDGTLNAYNQLPLAEDADLILTSIIKEKLNECFKHEIDAKYTSDPKKNEDLGKIHSGGLPPSWDMNTPIRC